MSTAQEMPRVSDIMVTASYNAAEDSNAAEMFPEITADVKQAVAERVPLSDDGADPIINIDIRKIALNGDTVLPDSTEFNEMEGVVSINTEVGGGGQSFAVNVTAVSGDASAPEGYIMLLPSTDDFYGAMIDGFAENVADRLMQLNLEGGSINR
jgi:hypothetical protein